jgi:hypothetical protein
VEGGIDNVTLHFYWKKDGELFTNGSILSVIAANRSHTGVYVCVVSIAEAGSEEERNSRNATVTVILSGSDSAPLIAMIVCVTAVTLIFTILFTAIGLYVCCGHPERQGTSCCSCLRRRRRKNHQANRTPVPGQLTPSAPRHFSKGIRSKSKSLSQLLQATGEEFPLDKTLCKDSANQLCGSQPTQATDIEDASTLDFDLALDEDMFQQETPLSQSADDDRIALLSRECDIQGRRKKSIRQEHVGEQREAKRRASEGQLVVPDVVQMSRKSILKESKSFNDGLHNQSTAVSDASSDITQSDENSLHLGKSVRFNVTGSGDDWASDSGVHTGTSTPHNIYLSLERRASEPEARGYHFANIDRRGSAPGDLVSKAINTVVHEESEEDVNEKGKENYSGEIDEGLATGSEEWSQQEQNYSLEETRTERRFEGAFSQPSTDDNRTISTTHYHDDSLTPRSSVIAARVAQLYSATQKQAKGNFIRGPSTLTTSSFSAVSKHKVSEMKEKFLQGRRSETSSTGREEGRRLSLSKLVQERAEVFNEKPLSDNNIMTGSLKRAHQQKEKTSNSHSHNEEKIKTESATDTKSLRKTKTEPTEAPVQNKKDTAPSTFSSPSIQIPVFSGPSGLSNWVPSCLRETVITPYQSYGDCDDLEQDSDDSEPDDMIMEPLEPTTGRDLIGAGLGTSFGGVATMSPIGRSWLPAGKPLGSSISPLAGERSPFNESFSLQRGNSARSAAAKRLSVIPEETASACSSVTDISKGTLTMH